MKSSLVLFIIIFQLQNIFGQNKIYFDKENTKISYSDTGFTIENIKNHYRIGFDKISVIFKDKNPTNGTITYYADNSSIGEFEFKEGVLLKGKMKSLIIDYEGFGILSEIQIKGNRIKTSLVPPKKFKIYTVLFSPNKIPHKLTYKNYKLLLNGFIDFSDNTKKVILKQYLLDGTLISEVSYNNIEKRGVFVNFKEQDNKIVYTIDYYKKGEYKPIKIKGLSFEKMLEELKKIEAAK